MLIPTEIPKRKEKKLEFTINFMEKKNQVTEIKHGQRIKGIKDNR